MSKKENKEKQEVVTRPANEMNLSDGKGNNWYEILWALPPVIYAAGWALDKIGFNVKDILAMDGRIHFKKGDMEFDIDRMKNEANKESVVDSTAEEINEES